MAASAKKPAAKPAASKPAAAPSVASILSGLSAGLAKEQSALTTTANTLKTSTAQTNESASQLSSLATGAQASAAQGAVATAAAIGGSVNSSGQVVAAPANNNNSINGGHGAVTNTSQSVNAQGQDVTTIYYADGTTNTTTSTGLDAGVQTQRQSVYDTVNALFTSYGIYKTDPVTGQLDTASQQLQSTINNLAMSGASQDAISLQLQTSQAYMTRFSGNTQRLKAGLNVLAPADYLNYENYVTGLMKDAGLPPQYYTQSAIGNLIGTDLSTSEVASRISLAQASVANADPYYTSALQQYYGISPQQMVAHVLDPSVSSTLLNEQVGASQIGAEAARQGLSNTVANSQYLYGAGVTQAQAQKGYGTVASVLPAATNISNIYGNQTGLQYNQSTAEQQYLLNNGQAALTQQKLNQYETSNFQAQSGINPAVQTLRKSMQGKF